MPALMHKGKNYSGGGTSVTANPTGTATADLTKVGIENVIYNIKDANAAHLVDGKVPASELPAYVDDVLEYASLANFPAEGESGKIYIALDTNLTYRWGGSDYVEISQSLALGTTHQTAAYGDDAVSTAEPTYSEASTRTNLAGSGEKLSVIFGKIKKWFSDLKAVAFSGSYNDLSDQPPIPTVNDNVITIQLNGTTIESFTLNQNSNETINIQVTKSDVGLGNVGNFKAVSTAANQGLTDTEKGNARANIGAGSSSFSGDYNDLSNKPSLATVATSGSYTDLSNKPTIPAAQIQSDWNQTNTSAKDYIKNKPTIPTDYIPLSGTSNLQGDIVPSANNTYDLGANGNRFDDIWVKNVYTDSVFGDLYGDVVLGSGRKIYWNSGSVENQSMPTDSVANDKNLPTGSAVISYLNSNYGVVDSGLKTLSYDSSFVNYNGSNVPPTYRKSGHMVSVYGIATVKSGVTIAAGGSATMFTLPLGYRPSSELNFLQQASGVNIWNLKVNQGGVVTLERYRNGATQAAISNGQWLPFSFTFMTD